MLDPGLDGTAVPAAHRGLLRYAGRVLEDLAEGTGWDAEYPRDTWRLRNLGISGTGAEIRFGGHPPALAERPGQRGPAGSCRTGARPASARRPASGRLPGSRFLEARDVTALAQVDRALLERYLADLHRELAGQDIQAAGPAGVPHADPPARLGRHPAARACSSPRTTRQREARQCPAPGTGRARHGPGRGPRQPRPLDYPAFRLITLILIQCGLRSAALTLAFDCIARDRRRRPLPALLQPQNETRSTRAHR